MPTPTAPSISTNAPSVVTHPATPADQAAMAALRAMVEPNKGRFQGTAARAPFDALMARIPAPAGVTFRPDTVGGISGWWCQPATARPGEVVLHLHGGWFNWGSAEAYTHLVAHIAAAAGVPAFLPDYRLAPEHLFPAATEDVQATYRGLLALGFTRVAITGDSAGGNLALALLSFAAQQGLVLPVGAVALSPVTDLALTGASWETRATADPYFLRTQVEALVHSYLGDHDPADPLVSPLYADLAGLPPIRVHVGEDEVLLDDSLRYVARAVAAGVDAQVDVWEGMAHGFLSGIGQMQAATQALEAIGAFLTECLTKVKK